ncbi:hypothetical protein [Oleidesulfovibrio sp.]|uniref:hypothetical protein n=1 Tax=Oleidesulfovibrio sp. TaxID=2909707 RepID=UPI003A86010F
MTFGQLIHIRFFCAAASKAEASAATNNLIDVLKGFGTVGSGTPKQYWKIPEYYECSLEVRGSMVSESMLVAVTQKLGTGWERVGDNCYVWSHSENTSFVDNNIRWAELEFLDG